MHSMIECAIWYRFLLQLYYLLFYTYARYFVFYFNNTAFTWIYSEQYDLTPSNFSLAYLVFPTGCVVGSLLGGRLSDRAYKRKTFAARNNIEANANTKEPNFEMRLGIGMLGTCFIVWIGCLSVFGWCVQKKLHFAYGIACEFAGKYTITAFLVACGCHQYLTLIVELTTSQYVLQCCYGNNRNVFDQ